VEGGEPGLASRGGKGRRGGRGGVLDDFEAVAVDAGVHAVEVEERVGLRLRGHDGRAVALGVGGEVLRALEPVVGACSCWRPSRRL